MIQRERRTQSYWTWKNSSVLEAKERTIDKLEAKRLAHEKQLQEERTRYLLFALVGLTLIVVALVFSLYQLNRNRTWRTSGK